MIFFEKDCVFCIRYHENGHFERKGNSSLHLVALFARNDILDKENTPNGRSFCWKNCDFPLLAGRKSDSISRLFLIFDDYSKNKKPNASLLRKEHWACAPRILVSPAWISKKCMSVYTLLSPDRNLGVFWVLVRLAANALDIIRTHHSNAFSWKCFFTWKCWSINYIKASKNFQWLNADKTMVYNVRVKYLLIIKIVTLELPLTLIIS